MFFRPCIDIHNGLVKQIVGGSLCEGTVPQTNFQTDRDAEYFAKKYQRDGLNGGHVIMLDFSTETKNAAHDALKIYKGGLQIGGGITIDNAQKWLNNGASHVIVTSHVFHDGEIDWLRLKALESLVSRERIVLDLSCRKKDGRYYVVTDRWQKFTQVEVNAESLLNLSEYADEFLVHAVDVEGLQAGVDKDLIQLLSLSPISTIYAGGVQNIEDLKFIHETGNRLSATVGSTLDIFGGNLLYDEVVKYCRTLK